MISGHSQHLGPVAMGMRCSNLLPSVTRRKLWLETVLFKFPKRTISLLASTQPNCGYGCFNLIQNVGTMSSTARGVHSKEEIVKFLGEGAYSNVDLVKYTKSDGSSFHAAVKTSDDKYSLFNEIQILSKLRGCPRIIQYFGNDLEEGLDYKGNKVYKLLLEYASEGSLSGFMNKYTDRILPDLIRDFTRMILESLVSIHGHGLVHCDLKSDNLLVFPSKDSYELKICDFGISLDVGEVPDYWEKIGSPFVGTPNYMPPESLHDGVAKETIDLWSLGCLVLEMYVGKKPWPGLKTGDLVPILSDGNAPEIPESLPCDAREFIQTCFARNPEDRGSAYELLSHRFLCQEEMIDVVLVRMMLKLKIKRSLEKKKRKNRN